MTWSILFLILIFGRFSQTKCQQIFEQIDERMAATGFHMRTGKFVSGISKVSFNASKDISTLIKWLLFITKDLIRMIFIF